MTTSGGASLYNFMWVYRPEPSPTRPCIPPGGRIDAVIFAGGDPASSGKTTINLRLEHIDAILLYPSLLTPGIVMHGEFVELLILAKKGQKPLTIDHVNFQLKVHKGLEKGFDNKPLFARPYGKIKIIEKAELKNEQDIIETKQPGSSSTAPLTAGRFAGMVDKRAIEHLRGKGYTDIYKVVILDSFTLFWNADNNAYKDPATGKTTKRYYYHTVTGYWLEHILHEHGIKDGDAIINPDAPSAFAWNYIKSLSKRSVGRDWNWEFLNDPVVFRKRGSGEEITTAIHGDNKGTCTIGWDYLESKKFEKHLRLFDSTYRRTWKNGDLNVSTSSDEGVFWNVHEGRYKDLADRNIIYKQEKIFIPDENNTGEIHDDLVYEKIKELMAGITGIAGDGHFGFNVDDVNGVDMTRTVGDLPIVAWHPVFYYPAAPGKKFNIGHMADMHVVSRQYVLKKSKARVIETTDKIDGNDVSPELGDRLNIYGKNVYKLLQKFGESDEIDLVCLLGDFIDHIPDVYRNTIPETMSVNAVWESVKCDAGDRSSDYKKYIDFLIFYSYIVHFYRKYQKPILAVAGNHDCYSGVFGISPRINLASTRGNAGICADHNVTLYEGTLLFGESYGFPGGDVPYSTIRGNLTSSIMASRSLFNADGYKWFFTVLTPFSDYTITCPKQVFGGLFWGNDEDKIDEPIPAGHLPRANKSLSSKQKDLLEKMIKAADSAKKTVLLTHFTMVSYNDPIPHDGRNITIKTEEYTDNAHAWGTFEDKRKYLFDKIHEKKINFVISGHSHRRGVYIFTKRGVLGGSYELRSHSFSNDEPTLWGGSSDHAIIIPDSPGPLPRHKHGKFRGWGSDFPAGTAISFESSGALKRLRRVFLDDPENKPRFVVALDYLDIEGGSQVIEKFETGWSDIKGKLIPFRFELNLFNETSGSVEASDIGYNVVIEHIRIYSRFSGADSSPSPGTVGASSTPGGYWKVAEFTKKSNSAGEYIFDLEGDNGKVFTDYICDPDQYAYRRNFMAIKFNKRSGCHEAYEQYNYDSWWTFEVKIEKVEEMGSSVSPSSPYGGVSTGSKTGRVRYIISRERGFGKSADIPKFDERKKSIYGNKYV